MVAGVGRGDPGDPFDRTGGDTVGVVCDVEPDRSGSVERRVDILGDRRRHKLERVEPADVREDRHV